MATTTATQIQQLYVGLLGRAADQGGLNWWADQVTTGGKTLEDVRASFVTSTEYTTTYGAAATRADLVTSIYQNLFERTPSADEVKYWAETDTRPADQLVAAFIEFAGAADQAVINNKTFVAQTYTDTVGADFNKAASAEVIANVDGTSASVAAALATITNGTLPGQVPALTLINAVAAAHADQVAFETAGKADVDALVAKLAANDKLNTATDTVKANADATYAEKIAAVVKDADQFRVDASESSTAVLTALAGDAATATSTAYGKLGADAKPLADKYVAAVSAAVTAEAGKATDSEHAAVVAGLGADKSAEAGLVKLGGDLSANTAEVVYGAYVSGKFDKNENALEVRTAIDTALKGSDSYAAFKAAAVKDAADADATKAVADATAELNTAPGKAYVKAVSAQSTADKLVADAQAADANKVAAHDLEDAYTVKTDAVVDAKEALKDFSADGVKVADLTKAVDTAGTGVNVKDVFYFSEALTAKSLTPDFKIGSFAAGDSIVLDKGYTFNSGALTAGDNNALEFFLVKSDAGVQIVLEGANYGSSEVTANATTGLVASTNSDHAQVITLTGVTMDHVAVANGVVSYV